MLRDNVVKIVERYVEKYPFECCGMPEEDIWQKAARFWDTWDVAVPDFVTMFQEAIGDPSNNLIDWGSSHATEGIIELYQDNEQTGRQIRREFKQLNAYEEDLDERQRRMDSFRDDINEMLKHTGRTANRLKQDTHAAMAYLSLMAPEENYMFHSAETVLFAQYVDFDGRIGNGKTFKMKEYYKMCDEVSRIIKEHPEHLEKLKEKIISEAGEQGQRIEKVFEKDPDWHLLVYDLIQKAGQEKLYYTENIQPPVKAYTEDDIRRIRIDEDEKRINREVSEIDHKLKVINTDAQFIEYPDLTGQMISIKKKIGSGRVRGTILSCDGKVLQVQLPDRVAKYAVSALAAGILQLEDQNMAEPYKKKEQLDKMKEQLNKKKRKITKELKGLEQ